MIIGPPAKPLDRAAEPPAGLAEIAFTRERPPRETAAEARQKAAGHASLPQPLHGKRGAARTDQPPRERDLLARAVPSTPIPDADRCSVRRQIELAVDSTRDLRHAQS